MPGFLVTISYRSAKCPKELVLNIIEKGLPGRGLPGREGFRDVSLFYKFPGLERLFYV